MDRIDISIKQAFINKLQIYFSIMWDKRLCIYQLKIKYGLAWLGSFLIFKNCLNKIQVCECGQ